MTGRPGRRSPPARPRRALGLRGTLVASGLAVVLLAASGPASTGPGSAPCAAGEGVSPPVEIVLTALAPRSSADLSERLARVIREESTFFEVDPLLVLSLIEVESAFRVRARSFKGAAGLMQIKPSVARVLCKELGFDWRGVRDLEDPILNVRLGIYYVHLLRRRFADLEAALTAYNYGPSFVSARLRRGLPLPTRFARRVLSARGRLGGPFPPELEEALRPLPPRG